MRLEATTPPDLFAPVEPSPTFEAIVERLENAISGGLLAPGARLPPERELAPKLGVSRWTLRKAITTLTQTGHLESRKGRHGGSFVAQRPPLRGTAERGLRPGWRDVLDFRMALELGAITLAARRRAPEHLARLEHLVEAMEDCRCFDDYRRSDVRFHVTIAEAARAPRLLAAMTNIQSEASAIIAFVAHPPTVLAHANDEHGQMVEALRTHDAESASRLMRRHLEGTERIIAALNVGG